MRASQDGEPGRAIIALLESHGLVRVTPLGEATLALSGANIVGVAFSPLGTVIVATNEAVYEVDLGVEGLLLF